MINKTIAPTLDDVAKLAQVSTATVSRCLNAPEKLSQPTRDKVMHAVENLGYTPNFGGQVLASKKTNTMGAVIPTMENSIFARGLQAFQERLAMNNITTLVASTNYDSEVELRQIRSLISRGADGLLLIGTARSKETYEFLKRRNVPYVIAWNYHADDHQTYVGFDNIEATVEMVDHIVSYGHRHLAMIAGNSAMNDRAADRILGAKKGVEKYNLPAFPIVESSYSIDEGGKAFEHIIKHNPDTTCVICGNDVLGVGAIIKAKKMGIRVPQDISITGFDDIELSEIIEPALTTVHVPHRKMGELAAQALVDYNSNEIRPKNVILSTHVIHRNSLLKLN